MITELITEIAYEKVSLSQALTRAKLIQAKIKNEDLKYWLIKELEGYVFNDPYLPPYRKIPCTTHLTAVFPFNRTERITVTLPNDIDPKVADAINFQQVLNPISIIEKQAQLAGEHLSTDISPQQLVSFNSLYSDALKSRHGTIKEGERIIGKVNLINILEQTKQKLLDTLIELEQLFPNISNDYQMDNNNKEKVQNIITNNIYGNNNPMNIAAGNTVEQHGNTNTVSDSDFQELKELGVEEADIQKLKDISKEQSKDKKPNKILGWLSSVTSSLVARGLYDNIPLITEKVHHMFQ